MTATAKQIAEEIAANPDEVTQIRLTRLASQVGEFIIIRPRWQKPLYALFLRIFGDRLYRAWVKGFEAGRTSSRRRGDNFGDWRDSCLHKARKNQ